MIFSFAWRWSSFTHALALSREDWVDVSVYLVDCGGEIIRLV